MESKGLRAKVFFAIRSSFSLAIILSLALSCFAPAFAAGGQTGNLNGTVVDSTTRAPIAGATISAKSGSGSYTARTDAKGYFSILGMSIDSYTVTVAAAGHDTVNLTGVTVFGDETDTVGTVPLAKSLRTIAIVTSRSAASAYQPTQTIDSYTVNSAEMLQTTGKAASTDENAVLLSVPGVTLTNNGTVTIRGGAAYEVGYQLDGVTFKEPFLGNNGSNSLMNGIGSVQVVEGAGDATQGGVGAGVINVIPETGSGRPHGMLDFEGGGPNFNHQLHAEYGFSTSDNRISDFASYTGQRYSPYLGYSNTPIEQYGNYFATQNQANDQFENNFFFRFGKNNNQDLQVLYVNMSQREYGQQGPGGLYDSVNNPNALVYYPYDQLTQGLWQQIAGYTPAQYASLIGLGPGVPTTNVAITNPQQNFSNQTRFLKFEYDNHIDSSTYFALRYYNWEELQYNDNQYSLGAWQTGTPGESTWGVTGGPTVGMSADLTKQLTSNLIVTVNAKEDVLHPIWDGYQPQLQIYGVGLIGNGSGTSLADWLPGGYLCGNNANGPGGSGVDYFNCATPGSVSDTRIPAWGIGYNGAFFQNWGAGIRFQYSPGDKWKIDAGVRDEGQNQHWFNQLTADGQGPPPNINPFDVGTAQWTTKVLYPNEIQPRLSIVYDMDRNDAIRFGYGRSAVFADAQTAGTPFHLYGLTPYLNIPAPAGSMCGVASVKQWACTSYAQALYWAGDAVEAPDAGNGTPAIYTNYDLSYSHQFKNGYAVRVTPFIKDGMDLPTFFLLNPTIGIFAVSNEGVNKTAGVELNLTTPQRALGFNGFASLTYQNVLSTTPPFTQAETTVPLVPTASLALNDLYRAGYVSPLDLRIGAVENLKNGFSISPQLEYNIGYPYSVGNMIAAQIAPGVYANIPQVNFGPGITGGMSSLIGNNPGGAVSTNYYDPAYPGTAYNPNIAASRGTSGTAANGGLLSHPNLLADLTLQWKHQGNTIGVQFLNLFGNAYINSVPAINPWYQPVANGVSGPQTGYNTCVNQVQAARGCYPWVPKSSYAFSNGAYLLSNGNFTAGPSIAPLIPFSIQVFYQRAI